MVPNKRGSVLVTPCFAFVCLFVSFFLFLVLSCPALSCFVCDYLLFSFLLLFCYCLCFCFVLFCVFCCFVLVCLVLSCLVLSVCLFACLIDMIDSLIVWFAYVCLFLGHHSRTFARFRLDAEQCRT